MNRLIENLVEERVREERNNGFPSWNPDKEKFHRDTYKTLLIKGIVADANVGSLELGGLVFDGIEKTIGQSRTRTGQFTDTVAQRGMVHAWLNRIDHIIKNQIKRREMLLPHYTESFNTKINLIRQLANPNNAESLSDNADLSFDFSDEIVDIAETLRGGRVRPGSVYSNEVEVDSVPHNFPPPPVSSKEESDPYTPKLLFPDPSDCILPANFISLISPVCTPVSPIQDSQSIFSPLPNRGENGSPQLSDVLFDHSNTHTKDILPNSSTGVNSNAPNDEQVGNGEYRPGSASHHDAPPGTQLAEKGGNVPNIPEERPDSPKETVYKLTVKPKQQSTPQKSLQSKPVDSHGGNLDGVIHEPSANPIHEPVCESVKESACESGNESFKEPVKGLLSESNKEPSNESREEPVNDPGKVHVETQNTPAPAPMLPLHTFDFYGSGLPPSPKNPESPQISLLRKASLSPIDKFHKSQPDDNKSGSNQPDGNQAIDKQTNETQPEEGRQPSSPNYPEAPQIPQMHSPNAPLDGNQNNTVNFGSAGGFDSLGVLPPSSIGSLMEYPSRDDNLRAERASRISEASKVSSRGSQISNPAPKDQISKPAVPESNQNEIQFEQTESTILDALKKGPKRKSNNNLYFRRQGIFDPGLPAPKRFYRERAPDRPDALPDIPVHDEVPHESELKWLERPSFDMDLRKADPNDIIENLEGGLPVDISSNEQNEESFRIPLDNYDYPGNELSSEPLRTEYLLQSGSISSGIESESFVNKLVAYLNTLDPNGIVIDHLVEHTATAEGKSLMQTYVTIAKFMGILYAPLYAEGYDEDVYITTTKVPLTDKLMNGDDASDDDVDGEDVSSEQLRLACFVKVYQAEADSNPADSSLADSR